MSAEDSETHSEEDEKEYEKSIASYGNFARATASMRLSAKNDQYIADADLIDTGYSTLSTVGVQLIPAMRVASVRKFKSNMEGSGR